MSVLQPSHLATRHTPSPHQIRTIPLHKLPEGYHLFADAGVVPAVAARIADDGYPAAEAALAEHLRRRPDSADLHALRALCLLHMGAHHAAADALAQACRLSPMRIELWALHAIALCDVHGPHKAAEARISLTHALALAGVSAESISSAHPFLTLAQAKVAYNGGDYRQAAHAIDAAVQQAPRCALTRAVQTDIALALSGPDKALALTSSLSSTASMLLLKSPHLQAVDLIARSHLGRNDPETLGACRRHVESLQQHGAYVPYILLATAVLAHVQGGPGAALGVWEAAPKSTIQSWLPAQVHRIGVLVGTDALAAADLLRAIAPGHSKHPGVRRARAQVLEATGRHGTAEQAWARLAAGTEAQVRTEALWAQARRPDGTQPLDEGQKSVLERLLEHDPSHPQALYQLANHALVSGTPDEAIRYGQRLLAVGDSTGRGHFILGMTRFGPAPSGHFRKFLEAPHRDAALLDEARLYVAHQAFASALWDEAIAQVRALPPLTRDADVQQSLMYLEAQCAEGLILTQAEAVIAANRQMLVRSALTQEALTDALHAVERCLVELGTLTGGPETALRLALLGQQAWLYYRVGQSSEATQSLIDARCTFASSPDAIWPLEAEQATLALRAQRWAAVRRFINYVFDLLKDACLALGSKALAAGVDYLQTFLTEALRGARSDSSLALVY